MNYIPSVYFLYQFYNAFIHTLISQSIPQKISIHSVISTTYVQESYIVVYNGLVSAFAISVHCGSTNRLSSNCLPSLKPLRSSPNIPLLHSAHVSSSHFISWIIILYVIDIIVKGLYDQMLSLSPLALQIKFILLWHQLSEICLVVVLWSSAFSNLFPQFADCSNSSNFI